MSERRAIDQDEETLLEELVVRCLDRFESEGAAAIEAVCREHPAQAAALRVRISSLREAGLLDDAAQAGPAFPERLGDFRLLERLGGGAMGVVYRALQESLGREVALKLIRPEQMYFPGARERFRREVEAVARLQHPGVVPIYMLGEERGIPFFAMELVHGCTLADVIETLGAREPRELSGADFDRAIAAFTHDAEQRAPAAIFAGTWVDASVRIVREAAEALEHVHRRHVLHRDIKPSNVMVTRDGRVMLVDFGLASAKGVDRLTRTGSQVGSLAYMSPEQLRGAHSQLDARSDVYSLGIVMYELLALQLPYDGDSVTVVRQLIEAGRPRALRARNPAVDWDVETVCFTAIEHDAARRYATASDFAHDLTNVLERRPIAARRASLGLRVRRWARRNPAASVAVVLAVLLVLGAPALYAWQQHVRSLEVAAKNVEIAAKNVELQRAFDGERSLRAESDAQRARAERNFGAALEAVRTMLRETGARELESVPEMEDTRRKLLEKALAFYEGLARDAGESVALRVELALTQRYIADVAYELSRMDQARAAYGAAIAAFRRLHEEQPANLQHASGLSSALVAQGRFRIEEGQFDEGVAELEEAVELARATFEADPSSVPLRCELARALRWRANLAKQIGRMDDAERYLEETLSVCRDEGVSSKDPELLDLEAAALITLGNAQMLVPQVAQARASFQRAAEIRQAALDREPTDRWARTELAEALSNLGMSCWSDRDPGPAEDAYRRALALQETLVRDFPRIGYYRHGLSFVAQNLGVLLHRRRNDLAGGEQYLSRAVEAFGPLLVERPDSAEYHYGSGVALASLAAVQRDQGRLELAAETIERAMSAQRKALAINPQGAEYLAHFRNDVLIACDVHIARGAHAEAAERAREALAHAGGQWETIGLAATRLSMCVALAEQDAALDATQREQLVEAYTRESLAALEAAVETGDAIWDEIAGSEYLDSVREQPRFAELEELARKKAQ